jgi:hypothetical protein
VTSWIRAARVATWALLGAGRGHAQREQVAQRVHGQMHLAAAALVPVVARPRPALGARLQRPRVEERRGRRLCPPLGQAQHRAQVMDEVFEHARAQPALRLLIDGGPGRQVVRQQAPLRAGAHDPAQAIEDLAQGVLALRGVFRHQRQVGGHQGPFLVTHIARIGCAVRCFGCHGRSIPRPAQSA